MYGQFCSVPQVSLKDTYHCITYIVYNAEILKLLLDYINKLVTHTHTFFNYMFTWELYPTADMPHFCDGNPYL